MRALGLILLMLGSAAQAGPVPLNIDGLPRASVAWRDHGEAMTCEGVWLIDLVARAGAPTGDAIRGPALTNIIIATAADGYRAVFSFGELDRRLGATPVLVADRCNGAPLASESGPLRLVVPGDARGARSVRQLRTLVLQSVED